MADWEVNPDVARARLRESPAVAKSRSFLTKGREAERQTTARSLGRHGYKPCGCEKLYKKIVSRSYLQGGGFAKDQLRMWIPDTRFRVTVGPSKTCFYEVVNGNAGDFLSIKTAGHALIREHAKICYAKAEKERN